MPIIPTPPIRGNGPPVLSTMLHNFTGGLNTKANPTQLTPSELPDISNMDLMLAGGVIRRGAFRSLGATAITTANTPQFLFHMPNDTDNGAVFLGAQSAGPATDKLSYWKTVTEGTAPTATRSFTTASSNNYYWSGALMKKTESPGDQNLFIHRDYLSRVQAWQTSDELLHSEMTDAYGNYNDNTAAPGAGTMPKASIMCTHLDMMFHADCYENSIRRESRLRWSHPGHPGDYKTNDFIDVGEGQDNDRIYALASFNQALFIFKQESVWVLEGYSSTTFSIRRIVYGLGAPNHNAVCSSQYGVAFFDRDLGAHMLVYKRFNGTYMWHAEPLWLKLNQPIYDGVITNTRQACVTWVGSKLVVSGIIKDGAAEPNVTFIMDMQIQQGWTRYDVGFRNVQCYYPFNKAPRLMGAAPWDGSNSGATNYDKVVIQDLNTTATDKLYGTNNISIASYFKTYWVTGSDSSLKKRFRRFSIVFSNLAVGHGLTVTTYKNWTDAVDRTFTVDGDYTSGTIGQKNVRSGAIGSAYAVAVKIAGPTDRAYNVDLVTFRFVPRRVR